MVRIIAMNHIHYSLKALPVLTFSDSLVNFLLFTFSLNLKKCPQQEVIAHRLSEFHAILFIMSMSSISKLLAVLWLMGRH